MTTTPQPSARLETALELALDTLILQEVHTEEHSATLEKVMKLHKLKQDEQPKRLDPNTVLTVAANILGIILITKHERTDIITSKAMSFVLKPRS